MWLRSYMCAPPLGCPVSHTKAPKQYKIKIQRRGESWIGKDLDLKTRECQFVQSLWNKKSGVWHILEISVLGKWSLVDLTLTGQLA